MGSAANVPAEVVSPLSTAEYLLHKYGPLMTLVDLAEVLRRSEDGLRVSLPRRDPLYSALRAARARLGRRTYFRTVTIAVVLSDLIDEGKAPDA